MFLLLFIFLIFLVLLLLNIRKRKKNNLESTQDIKKTRILLGLTVIFLILYIVSFSDSNDNGKSISDNSSVKTEEKTDNKDNDNKNKEEKKQSKIKTYSKKDLDSMSYEELDNIPSDEYNNMSAEILDYYYDRLFKLRPEDEKRSIENYFDEGNSDEMSVSEYKKVLNAYKTQMEIVGEDLTSLNKSLESGMITSETKDSAYNAEAMYESASGLIRTPLKDKEPPEKYKDFNDRLISMDDRYLNAFDLLNESAEANDEASMQVALDTLETITEEYVVNVKHSLVD